MPAERMRLLCEDLCYTPAPYDSDERTTALYICLALLKVALHIDAATACRPRICFFAFVIMRRICAPHCSLGSSQIPSTRTSSLDWIMIPGNVRFVCVSTAVRLCFEKWINSYFCGAGCMPDSLAQVINRACTLPILLQFPEPCSRKRVIGRRPRTL